ncbi:hypothetical protein Tco_0752633 [Tanacetum coccineum]|uniref:Synaptobrevin, longin-like domain protein n=1 Tax=Tanacetum coccineum TaxID=301880 RepID=A0ABQ4ZA94_9ASTR
MLLGINLLLLLKVNAARHNLLLLVTVNAVEVDGKKIIITESTVRRDLQREYVEGVDYLPNSTIFEQLILMGYEKISQKLTFYKAFFSPQWKFLSHTILQCLSSKTTAWNEFSSTMAFKQKPRKPKRKDTQIPQSSGPTKHVADEAIYKELDDSLANPNESSSLGTTSGGGPRHQETMGDTIAQTMFENVSKHSNDPLLARGNTLQSGEDSLKLNELMELYTNLQTRVLDLEKTKTTQAEEIVSLKRRFKKFEQKKRSRTYGLKRINAIDADEDITLVNDQDDAYMFNVNTLTGDEVLAKQEVATKDVNLTVDEVTLAQALAALKSIKSQANVVEELSVPVSAASTKVSAATTTTTATIPTIRKGIVIIELGTSTTTTTISLQPSHVKVQDKGKEKMIEPEKPLKKKDQLKLDEEIALKLQAKIDKEERLTRELQAEEQEQFITEQKATLFKELLEQRRKHFNMEETDEVDDDQEVAKIKKLMEIVPDKEEAAIDAIPLATKPPTIVDWKIHKEGKKKYYQIIRADGSSKMYLVFSHMLKSFNREDFETLWKLVKAKYGSTRLVEYLDLILWGDLKTTFEPYAEDRSSFLKDATYAHSHAGRKEISPYTCYNYWIKSFLMLFGITTVLIDVNAAQLNLVLLENFNENYSKCLTAGEVTTANTKLLLLEEVTIAIGSYYC